jgi:hypothetical protein
MDGLLNSRWTYGIIPLGFLTISSIWLLPVMLPDIQAQQTATPP